MLATLLSATLVGLDGRRIRVEVDVAPGLPGFTIVGLADAALREARERVRGAIRNAGFIHPPRRITVNLAPADLPKGGSSVDLAIAVGILLGSEQFRAAGGRTALIGELSLGSEVRPVPGLLPMLGALDAPEPDGFIVLGILIPQNATPSARTGDQARRSRGVDEVRSAASRHVVRGMTATAGAPERLHWYTVQRDMGCTRRTHDSQPRSASACSSRPPARQLQPRRRT